MNKPSVDVRPIDNGYLVQWHTPVRDKDSRGGVDEWGVEHIVYCADVEQAASQSRQVLEEEARDFPIEEPSVS